MLIVILIVCKHFIVSFCDSYEEDNTDLTNMNIRPRANTVLKFKDIEVGQRVMANYNYDDPDERGFWYDCVISKKQDTRTIKDLYATVFIGYVVNKCNYYKPVRVEFKFSNFVNMFNFKSIFAMSQGRT